MKCSPKFFNYDFWILANTWDSRCLIGIICSIYMIRLACLTCKNAFQRIASDQIGCGHTSKNGKNKWLVKAMVHTRIHALSEEISFRRVQMKAILISVHTTLLCPKEKDHCSPYLPLTSWPQPCGTSIAFALQHRYTRCNQRRHLSPPGPSIQSLIPGHTYISTSVMHYQTACWASRLDLSGNDFAATQIWMKEMAMRLCLKTCHWQRALDWGLQRFDVDSDFIAWLLVNSLSFVLGTLTSP